MDDELSSEDEELSEGEDVGFESLRRVYRRLEVREREELSLFLQAEKRCEDVVVGVVPPGAVVVPASAAAAPTRKKASVAKRRDEEIALKAEVAALENELQKSNDERSRLRRAKQRLEKQLAEALDRVKSVEMGQEAAKLDVEKLAEAKKAEIRKAQRKLDKEKADLAAAIAANEADDRPPAMQAELDGLRATIERLRIAGDEKHQKSVARQAALRAKIQAQDEKIKQLEEDVATAERAQLRRASDQRPSKPSSSIAAAAVKEPEEQGKEKQGLEREENPEWRSVRDGMRERVYSDGTREVEYKNGTTKKVTKDATFVNFSNGDTKRTESATGKVVYYYAEARTTHTSDPTNGIEIFEFPNGQIERHKEDGSKHITFPDGTTKMVHKDGRSETKFPDGVLVVSDATFKNPSL